MQPATGELVLEYLKTYQTLPSRRIAAILLRDYPELFSTFDQARDMTRYYRGTRANGSGYVVTKNYTPQFSAPEPETEEILPLVLDYNSAPIMLGGDCHIPYHDQDALEIFIDRTIELKAKTLVLAGDWLDFYQLSRFDRNPTHRCVASELETFKQVLLAIRNALPETAIYFKCGNHEERYEKYLMVHASALFGVPEFQLQNLLGLDQLKIGYVDSVQVIKFRQLAIIHGHEYRYAISNPVNPARGLALRAKKSALCFHHHQTSEHSSRNIDGETTTTWSAGCLCNLKPRYAPLNEWNHGFTEVHDDNGMFVVRNRRIINYKLI